MRVDRHRDRGSILPLADREEAGRLLAAGLRDHRLELDAVVLAIPRGGVPVAATIARELGLALDVLVAHKLGAPGNPELAVGAVAADGTTLIEPWADEVAGHDDAYLRRTAAEEQERVRGREAALRAGRPPLDLKGRTIILVDDGIATGATVLAALRGLRSSRPARVILAVPVAPPDTLERLSPEADEVVCLASPEPFYAVGQFYRHFDQTGDEEVVDLLRKRRSPADRTG